MSFIFQSSLPTIPWEYGGEHDHLSLPGWAGRLRGLGRVTEQLQAVPL